MKKLLMCMWLTVLFSCGENEKDSVAVGSSRQDTTSDTMTRPVVDKDKPTERFIDLVNYIDSAGYTWDSVRYMKKIRYADYREKKVIDSYLFYKMGFNDTPLSWYNNPDKEAAKANNKGCLLDESYFADCKMIWGYVYVQKGFNAAKDDFSVDGFIEEFEFSSIPQADSALNEIDRKKGMVFFFTGSYCCRVDRFLYIFNTRAGAYPVLEGFYKYFVKENDAVVYHNKSCLY